MRKIVDFLHECKVFYLATVGDCEELIAYYLEDMDAKL